MSPSEEEKKSLVAAICYKLGIKKKPDQLDEIWSKWQRSNGYQQQARKISQDLAGKLERAFKCMLEVDNCRNSGDDSKLVELWQNSLDVILKRQSELSPKEIEDIERIVSQVVNDVLKQKTVKLPPVEDNQKSAQDRNEIDKELEEVKEKISDKSNAFPKITPSMSQEITPPESINPFPAEDYLLKNRRDAEGAEERKKEVSVILEGEGSNPDSTKLAAAKPVSDSSENPVKKVSSNSEDRELPLDKNVKWNYLPVPEGLDKHDEFHCKEDKSPEGLKLIGARVRGKGHKHHGTNCDDWFEFSVSGNWTIVAVSDGAGSKNFSRVGAKVSCEAAVEYLVQELKNIIIKKRDTKKDFSADLDRDQNWVFPGKDIEDVQKVLHKAVQKAYDAVELAAKERTRQAQYDKIQNKDLEVKDFSATLLLAVHTIVKVEGTDYNLVLTSQVGDGMLAAVSREGNLQLLGKPDSGPYGGQTEFITSKNKLKEENIRQKTCVFPGHLKALMVMTDGVADDYFPNDPNILELYGDLVLNQVIKIARPNPTDIAENLRQTRLGSIGGIKQVKHKFQSKVERVIDPNQKNEPPVVRISSVADYAKELGKSVPEVVASSAMLAGGILDEQMCSQCQNMKPAQKLQLWLDSYYKRGSFDDRTLVVLYREEK
jgi:hypothetical protein